MNNTTTPPAATPQAVRATSAVQARYELLLAILDSADLPSHVARTAIAWREFAWNYMQRHPEPGMVLTYTIWTDRKVFEITRVEPSEKAVWARPMHAVRTDDNGMSESQSYRYEPGAGIEQRFSWREKPAVWKIAGSKTGEHGGTASLGVAHAYHDFSF